ncbi:fluoride efflux transporter CrcB [Lentilactobacillus sp. SPB1-3]|uniref:Fluoride efflux transporter CrcB n=1 Tax=Lentilactobacillus terminaliae TaxID=3003483 RepID=A0ACD5DGK3_9LACO|nr:fluoride efflux transporter CrcB [Lentilactobacillus sp. SPB1-3]MCZ0976714.1 fluoride efflux transporter CrcB [Lentilactobacillus sp. SPB1-3]
MNLYLLIGLGAAIGAVTRYDVTKAINRKFETEFPTATLTINLLGSFIIGVLTTMLINNPNWLTLLGTGFCGGFTTFSTMANECLTLLQQHSYRSLGWYLALTIVGGVSLAAIGLAI